MIRSIPLIALLLTQDAAIDLEHDRMAALYDGSRIAMITLIARYEDGTALRGEIQCGGSWYKHQDRTEDTAWGWELPFKTDSRGAVIMNPLIGDEWIDCWAAKDGYYGRVRVEFDWERPSRVVEIVMRRES